MFGVYHCIMIIRAIGGGFHWPARVAGMNQTLKGLLIIVGSPLGALLLSLIPLHGVMLVDVGTALFAVGPLLFIAIPQPIRPQESGSKKASIWVDMREGFRYLWGWSGAMALIGGALIFKVALTPAFSLVPLLVRSHFGGGAPQLALLDSVVGIGLLLGGLALSVWGGFKRKVYTLLMGIIGIGIGVTITGFLPANMFFAAIGSVFVIGLTIPMADGPIMAIFQTTVAPEMQGRVFALLGSLISLSSPLGLAIAGPVSDRFGIQVWFIIAGILCIAVGISAFFIPAILHIEENHTAKEAVETASPSEVGAD